VKNLNSKVFSSPCFYTLVLIVCSVIVFFPILNSGFFCWDDKSVALSPVFRHMTFAGILHSFFSFHVGLYHPLTSLSFMLDYYSGNGSAFPFHLTNLILHTGNTLLLFVLLIRLTGNLRISFITALLFAVHPVHVEAVAWITSRKDLLFTFFALLSLIFYAGYSEKKKNVINYILVLLSLVFALLSKIQAVSLPFVFLVMDHFSGKKFNARLFIEKVPFLLFCIFFGWLNILAQKDYGYLGYGYHFSLPERAFLLACSVSQYFLKVIFPYPLSVFYPFPFRPGEPVPVISFAGPVIVTLAIIAAFLFRRKINKMIIFGLLFFLVNILVVAFITFNRDFVMADRYLYLSSAGILLVIGVIADDLIRRHRNYRVLVLVFIVCYTGILSWSTVRRNFLWRNPVELFENALSFYDDSDIILNTLASQEIEDGNYENAISHLDKAVMISAGYSEAFYNRGIAYSKTGNLRASVDDFTKAIKINPAYDEAYFARGSAYLKSNDLKMAYDDFTSVIRMKPDHFGAFQDRAIVRGNLDDWTGALEDLNATISLNPDFAASYYLRGIALFNLGENGCNDLHKALSMGYKDALRALEHYCGSH
jgi:protein O-mannosyl-transferase